MRVGHRCHYGDYVRLDVIVCGRSSMRVNQESSHLINVVHGVSVEWIGSWNIHYRLGYDGISLPLVVLTSFISMLAAMASWSINKLHKGYFILFLLA